jgi:hypothetical protein
LREEPPPSRPTDDGSRKPARGAGGELRERLRRRSRRLPGRPEPRRKLPAVCMPRFERPRAAARAGALRAGRHRNLQERLSLRGTHLRCPSAAAAARGRPAPRRGPSTGTAPCRSATPGERDVHCSGQFSPAPPLPAALPGTARALALPRARQETRRRGGRSGAGCST